MPVRPSKPSKLATLGTRSINSSVITQSFCSWFMCKPLIVHIVLKQLLEKVTAMLPTDITDLRILEVSMLPCAFASPLSPAGEWVKPEIRSRAPPKTLTTSMWASVAWDLL
jgi:hypothetical protein